LEIKYKKQTITEHEVTLQMNRVYLCAQKSASNLVEEIWCGQKMFLSALTL